MQWVFILTRGRFRIDIGEYWRVLMGFDHCEHCCCWSFGVRTCTTASDSASSALVASSRSKIRGFTFIQARGG